MSIVPDYATGHETLFTFVYSPDRPGSGDRHLLLAAANPDGHKHPNNGARGWIKRRQRLLGERAAQQRGFQQDKRDRQ